MLSSGTYRHMQNEFEEIHDVNNGEPQRSGQNIIPDIQVGLSGGQFSEGKSNIEVFQKMRKDMSETPDQSNGDQSMKRQKSIKLNLNKAGIQNKNVAMMRKSSDLNKDTFRGQESYDPGTSQGYGENPGMITDPALGGVQNDSLQTNLVAGDMSSFKPIKRKSIQNDEYEITELIIKS